MTALLFGYPAVHRILCTIVCMYFPNDKGQWENRPGHPFTTYLDGIRQGLLYSLDFNMFVWARLKRTPALLPHSPAKLVRTLHYFSQCITPLINYPSAWAHRIEGSKFSSTNASSGSASTSTSAQA